MYRSLPLHSTDRYHNDDEESVIDIVFGSHEGRIIINYIGCVFVIMEEKFKSPLFGPEITKFDPMYQLAQGLSCTAGFNCRV